MATIPPVGAPSRTVCPFLGIAADDRRRAAPIDYPSFENRCWSASPDSHPLALLLTDQATLCLCAAHRQCPRFTAAGAARRDQPAQKTKRKADPPNTAQVSPDDINQALKSLNAELGASQVAQQRSRRRWGWIGAGLIFMSSLLCGGIFAGYVGWQLVSKELAATQPGTVDTLAAAAAPIQPQVYLIVTATSPPDAAAPAAPDGSYPAAVTATPSIAGSPAVNAQGESRPLGSQATSSDGAVQVAVAPQVVAPAPAAASPEVQAIPDVQLAIPTRRPTPVLDIPTSTSEPATPTATPTPTPQLGTPVVIFAPEDAALESGECTTVSWHVENVRAVFYENLGVNGHGEKEECLRDDPGAYNLVVILGDGSTRTFTATVDLIVPTSTPRPTPTFTEEAAPTPTWTPDVPTETPTPPIQYGARLDADDGGALPCSAGTRCEIELYVTNSSTVVDNLTISFSEAGAWDRSLCRLDGVCADNGLTVASVGPGNTGVIRLQITVPDGTGSGTQMTYRLHAASDGSGGTVRSETTTIVVTAE